MTTPPNEPWRRFKDLRPLSTFVHLDTAAAGRASRQTLSAVAGYAERESVTGAYVAAAQAAPVIAAGRMALGELLGVEAGGIAFVESATAAVPHRNRTATRGREGRSAYRSRCTSSTLRRFSISRFSDRAKA